ncbi:MAG TPA: hypothetical protein VI756_03850, partial [Blastocatellia bacterium]
MFEWYKRRQHNTASTEDLAGSGNETSPVSHLISPLEPVSSVESRSIPVDSDRLQPAAEVFPNAVLPHETGDDKKVAQSFTVTSAQDKSGPPAADLASTAAPSELPDPNIVGPQRRVGRFP